MPMRDDDDAPRRCSDYLRAPRRLRRYALAEPLQHAGRTASAWHTGLATPLCARRPSSLLYFYGRRIREKPPATKPMASLILIARAPLMREPLDYFRRHNTYLFSLSSPAMIFQKYASIDAISLRAGHAALMTAARPAQARRMQYFAPLPRKDSSDAAATLSAIIIRVYYHYCMS